MVGINNLTGDKVDEKFVKEIVETVLKGERKEIMGELSLAFIGPGRMRKLNKTYRKKNRVTDVLAFENSKVAFEKFKIGSAQKTEGLGEIVICLREVKKNARKFEESFEQELTRVLVHGVLHLLGYDHEKTKEEAEKMRECEERYLQTAKL